MPFTILLRNRSTIAPLTAWLGAAHSAASQPWRRSVFFPANQNHARAVWQGRPTLSPFPSSMKNSLRLLLGLALPVFATAQTAPTVQPAPALPSLAIVDKARLDSLETTATSAQKDTATSVATLVNSEQKESVAVKNTSSMILDSAQIDRSTSSTAAQYSAAEGAGDHNTTALKESESASTSSAKQNESSSAKENEAGSKVQSNLILPGKSDDDGKQDSTKTEGRTTTSPLLSQDFVGLGKTNASGLPDLSMFSNGGNSDKANSGSSAGEKDDQKNKVVSFAGKNSPSLVTAFDHVKEGEDKEGNHSGGTVSEGRDNERRMVSGPTPPLALTLPALLGFAAWCRRRFSGNAA